MRHGRLTALAATLCTTLAPTLGLAAGDAALEPYQMVRSLQLVQDRIASGDHAALPMQKKLLEMIDGRLRNAAAAEFSQPRNFRSLLIYGMSGGNPSTLETALARLELQGEDATIASGVLHYLAGENGQARSDLGAVHPEAHHESLAAFLYLVKGSVIGLENAEAAIRLYDRARLLAPGTLVEETALRRTILLSKELDDPEKFMSIASQYVRRFLRSPYAAQFADSFVDTAAGFANRIDTAELEEIISWMSEEQARTVYLRLSRISAIEGHEEMLAFASAKTTEFAGEAPGESGTRSALYTSISSVTSETVGEVLDRLKALDPTGLSRSDKALLRAAKTVAQEVVAPAGAAMPASAMTDGLDTVRETSSPVGAEPAASAEAEQVPSGVAATEELVSAARSKLEAIDAMLEEVDQ